MANILSGTMQTKRVLTESEIYKHIATTF